MSNPVKEYQEPDFELRNLILKTLRAHPRPAFHPEPGVKVACKCGWNTETNTRSNQISFQRHQAFEIEYAVTALLDQDAQEEQDQAA